MRAYKTRLMNRIRAAADGGVYETPQENLTNTAVLKLSFSIAVILLKLCEMPTLVRRFALAEARRAEKNLEMDLNTFCGQF